MDVLLMQVEDKKKIRQIIQFAQLKLKVLFFSYI